SITQLILCLTSSSRTWYDKHVRNYASTLFGAFSFLAQASLPVAPFVSVFLSAIAVLRHLCAWPRCSLDGRVRACSGGSSDPRFSLCSLTVPRCSYRSKDRPLQGRCHGL